MTKGDMRIMLEIRINEFLENGGSITLCKPCECRQKRSGSCHKGRLFPKQKRKSSVLTVVRKRTNGLKCEITVKKKRLRSKKIQKMNE